MLENITPVKKILSPQHILNRKIFVLYLHSQCPPKLKPGRQTRIIKLLNQRERNEHLFLEALLNHNLGYNRTAADTEPSQYRQSIVID